MDEKRKQPSKLNSAGTCAVLGITLLSLGLGGYFLFRGPQSAKLPEELPTAAEEQLPESEAREPILPPVQPVTPPAPPVSAPVSVPEVPTAAGDGPERPMPEVETIAPPEPAPAQEPAAPTLVVAPVQGQVLAAFSGEELCYSETLGDWRTHEGLDIGAKPGTTVLSAASGTVRSVVDDPLMGTTVTIDHVGGYSTEYANLQAKPTVLAGDEVSAGQIIGAVGETAVAESAQPPHLHFGVRKDGKCMDPEEFLERSR